MKTKSLLLGSLSIGILIFACRKTSSSEVDQVVPASASQLSAIQSWLHNQTPTILTTTNIDWERSEKVSSSDSSSLITIPITMVISNPMASSHLTPETDLTKNVLLIAIDKNNIIQQGNIAQLTPDVDLKQSHLVTLIDKMYKTTSDSYNGAFSLFTINDVFVYQMQYKGLKKYCELIPRIKSSSSEINTIKVNSLSSGQLVQPLARVN